MTAGPSQGRPLALVAQPDAVTDRSGRGADILRQWDPEFQFVGSLMHLSASTAKPFLGLVPDDAIWMPENRWVIVIIRDLVAQDVDPDPVTVLHIARRRGPCDMGTARVSPRRHHRFAIHLADLYTQAVAPVHIPQYAREVLEDAFRRAVGIHGARLADLADRGTDRIELAHHLSTMRAELAELWRRAEAARPAVGNP